MDTTLLWDGIKLGFLLSILVGPLLITLVQTSIEQGAKASTMIGLGIWCSDLMFISIVYSFLSYIKMISELSSFKLWVGCIGGLILLLVGIANIVTKTPMSFNNKNKSYQRTSSYSSLWLKGFAINTFNPFTVVFWTGISSNILIKNENQLVSSFLFYGSILIVVILTDLLKIILAKKIRFFLNPKRINNVRIVSGFVLIIFGLALIGRVLAT